MTEVSDATPTQVGDDYSSSSTLRSCAVRRGATRSCAVRQIRLDLDADTSTQPTTRVTLRALDAGLTVF